MKQRSAFQRVMSGLVHLPDRLLHKRRHRAAVRAVSLLGRPQTILVICHGNICRSPYMEALLRRALPDIKVSSAGFVGPGRPVPAFSLEVSAKRGLDLTGFRSRSLVPAEVREMDLVVVMDERQASHVASYLGVPRERIVIAGDLDPRPGPTRSIEDPWQQPIEAYVAAFDRLDRCAASLVLSLRPSNRR